MKGIDWDLLNNIADYYKKNGGETDERLKSFLMGRIAEYFDPACEKTAEERCLPLLSSYLRGGIDGRADKKTIKNLFDYLIDLTEKPFSSVEYKGDKTIKLYLEQGEGGKISMARKYDDKWFVDSVDSVVGVIENNLAFLDAILDDFEEPRRTEVTSLMAKYEALRDRVAALKNTCPESQWSVLTELKKIVAAVKAERRNLEIKNFYPSLRATTVRDNVFLQVEESLKTAEGFVTNPPKGAKIPSDYEKGANMIMPEKESSDFIQKKSVKSYREQCRVLRDDIDEDFVKRQKFVDKQEAELAAVDEKLSQLNQKKEELLKRYKNGLLNASQVTREADLIKLQETSLNATKARRTAYSSAVLSRFSRLNEVWSSIIRLSVDMVIEDDTDDQGLIKHFTNINEILVRFRGYINGLEGADGENLDFSLLEKFIQETTASLQQQVQEARMLIDRNRNPFDPIMPKTEQMTGDSMGLDDAISYLQGSGEGAPSETIRPETETAESSTNVDFFNIIGNSKDD